MRPILWITVGLVVALAIAAPVLYFRYAGEVAEIRTTEELTTLVQRVVENERMRVHAAMTRGQIERFEVISFKDINKQYLAILLSWLECLDYLVLPREPDGAWGRRLLAKTVLGDAGEPGAARCDMYFSEYLALQLGYSDDIRRGIATNRIHSVVSKEDLVRLRISATWFGPGVYGLPSASKQMLKRDFRDLDLAEAAELYVAETDWEMVRTCKNAGIIRQMRDNVLDWLGNVNGATQAEISTAKAKPVACLRP